MSKATDKACYNADMLERLMASLPVPGGMAMERVYNVSFDLNTQAITLYFLDTDGTSLVKVSERGVSKQYLAEPGCFDPNALFSRLGQRFDLNQVVPDTVEQNRLYLYLEPAEVQVFTAFLHAFARCHQVSDERLLIAINAIAGHRITGFCDAHKKRALSMVRISLDGDHRNKLYSRPWLHGEGHQLCHMARVFLCELYACASSQLDEYLKYAWLSVELETGRLVVATQRHYLLHAS